MIGFLFGMPNRRTATARDLMGCFKCIVVNSKTATRRRLHAHRATAGIRDFQVRKNLCQIDPSHTLLDLMPECRWDGGIPADDPQLAVVLCEQRVAVKHCLS